jgi:uncharacterized repeat protein (TIGR03803 family)
MKISSHRILGLITLQTGLNFLLPVQAEAQVFTNLYSFSAFDSVRSLMNSDGANPVGGVTLSGNSLFGTTWRGGYSGFGTIFAINTDGSGFMSLYQFSGGSDGKTPRCGVVLSGNTLYGTTSGGGNGVGNIFAVNPDGSGFTDLYDFSPTTPSSATVGTNFDGTGPNYLVVSGGTLYGTAGGGGRYGSGTVFSLNIDGSGFTALHTFAAAANGTSSPTNADGASPLALTISGNILYGTTAGGGGSGYGTLFKINTDGTGFAPLHSFTLPRGTAGYHGTNADGATPTQLIIDGDSLYGKTTAGGLGVGTVFKLKIDGTGYAVLYTGDLLFGGANSGSGLVLSGNTLYWWNINGDICAVHTDGSGLTTLHVNDDHEDDSGLIISGNMLYGVLTFGGAWNSGIVFSCLIPPQLSLIAGGPSLSLSWSTNFPSYVLQTATTLANGGDWRDSTATPSQTNSQNIITVGGTDPTGFFRLRKAQTN